MKQIIRIEHNNGIGIFTHEEYSICENPKLCIISIRHNNFNTPSEDNLDMNMKGKEYFCAYKSISQLQKWILKEELIELYNIGYKFLLLTVTDYQEGRDQIIYTKESIISSQEISEIIIN